LELFDSPQPLRCCYQKGLAQPLLHGASAKALLAHLEDARREELYLAQEMSGERIAALEAELRRIRDQGYAVSQGEIDEGVWGISVPLLDSRRRLHGALSLMAPALRAQARSERLRQWT
ncbi:IclR family transcriptional regulator, partial [Pseudomonas aeruginosa]|nr:IclR family transcriptional regulator [Pseudomonas aeruginosa]